MKLLTNLLVLGAALQLSACASIISGTKQTIDVNTDPQGASCGLARKPDAERDAYEFARIDPTPGQVTLEKTKYDITLSCAKPGYENTNVHVNSDTDATVFGNAIFGGLIGWGIDSARGADNKYDTTVTVPMKALPATVTTTPVETAPVASPALPLRPLVDAPAEKPVEKAPEPISAPAAAKLVPAATSPTAPAPVVQTKYPHVAPEPQPQEVPVTGYIAPVPWYKGPAPKPRAVPVSAAPAAPQNTAANSAVAIPVTPQEVSDNAPFKRAK